MSNPFVRAYLASVGLLLVTAFAMFKKHMGPVETFDWPRLIILACATAVVGLPIGFLMRRAKRPWSWLKLSAITFPVWLFAACIGVAAYTVIAKPPPKFKNPDDMMDYMAHQTTRWVKKDTGITLDYSIESIKVVEEQLTRISKEVNKTNAQEVRLAWRLVMGLTSVNPCAANMAGHGRSTMPLEGCNPFHLHSKEGRRCFQSLGVTNA